MIEHKSARVCEIERLQKKKILFSFSVQGDFSYREPVGDISKNT